MYYDPLSQNYGISTKFQDINSTVQLNFRVYSYYNYPYLGRRKSLQLFEW